MNLYENLMHRITGGGGAALRTVYTPEGAARSLLPVEAVDGWQFEQGENGHAVLTEYFSPHPRFIILGGGHIALPLSQFAAAVGFSVTVFDDRPEFANAPRFPAAAEVVCDRFEGVVQRLGIATGDYVAVVTRGHRYDLHCLRAILGGAMPAYLGMIGSRRKVSALCETLLEEGAAPELMEQLHAPIGLAIGASTPEEIAIAIVAEMIAHRRQPGKGGGAKTAADCDFELIRWLAGHAGEYCAVATVVGVKGSAPRGIGAKIAVLPHGQIIGSIGGGCAEAGVRREALDIIGTGAHRLFKVDLTGTAEDDGMVCGGTMDVLLEDFGPTP